MRKIARLRQAFLDADALFAKKQWDARSTRTRQFWIDRRSVNDQAYFVMIFAQLEDHVNVQCQRLVSQKQSLLGWKRRRLWDDIDINDLDRMRFMRRVSLLTQRGHSDYNKINNLYRIRCEIAHGGTYASMNAAVEAAEMYNIARRLRV